MNHPVKCGSCGLRQDITQRSGTEGQETNAIQCVCGAITKIEWKDNKPIVKEVVNPLPYPICPF